VTDKYLVVAATGCTPVDPPAPPWATLDPALDGSWGTAWEDECGTLAGELCTSGKVQHTVCFLIEGSSGTMVHIMRSKGIKDKSGNRFEGVLNGKAEIYPITYLRSQHGFLGIARFFVNPASWSSTLLPYDYHLEAALQQGADDSIGFTTRGVESVNWFKIMTPNSTTIQISANTSQSPSRHIEKGFKACVVHVETPWIETDDAKLLLGGSIGLLLLICVLIFGSRKYWHKNWLEDLPDRKPEETSAIVPDEVVDDGFRLTLHEVIALDGTQVREGDSVTSPMIRHLPRGMVVVVVLRRPGNAGGPPMLQTRDGWLPELGTRRLSEGLRATTGDGAKEGETPLSLPSSGVPHEVSGVFGTLGHVRGWGLLKGYKMRDTPGEMPNLKGCVTALSCGRYHCVAVCNPPGLVYSWGMGADGRLGTGSEEDCGSPIEVTAMGDKRIVEVSCGDSHTLALGEGGRVFAWGVEGHGRIDALNKPLPVEPHEVWGMGVIVQVAAGAHHSLCLDEYGSVYAWGRGQEGQLGLGGSADQAKPCKVIKTHYSAHQAGWIATQVSAGGCHSAAVTQAGLVYTWGDNRHGQLGNGTQQDLLAPTRVIAAGDGLGHMAEVAAGADFTMAISTKGRVSCWGDAASGKLGLGDRVARKVPCELDALKDVRVSQIACGEAHVIALASTGEVYTWGSGAQGRLGTTDRDVQLNPTEVKRLWTSGVLRVNAGVLHSAAICYPWGAPKAKGKGPVDTSRLPLIAASGDAVLCSRPPEPAAVSLNVPRTAGVLAPLEAAFKRVEMGSLATPQDKERKRKKNTKGPGAAVAPPQTDLSRMIAHKSKTRSVVPQGNSKKKTPQVNDA